MAEGAQGETIILLASIVKGYAIMDVPKPLQKLSSIIEDEGWRAGIQHEVERKLTNYPDLEEKPDVNPLAEAYRQVELLKSKENLRLQQKETWKLIALILDGRILQRQIRKKHLMERMYDEADKSTINRTESENLRPGRRD